MVKTTYFLSLQSHCLSYQYLAVTGIANIKDGMYLEQKYGDIYICTVYISGIQHFLFAYPQI